VDVRGHGPLLGHGPQNAPQRTGNGANPLGGVLAAAAQASRAFPESPWGLPAEVLEGCGVLGQAPWQMAPDCGGGPRRPGPCAQDAPGRRVAGGGNGARSAARARRRCRRDEAQALHQCSWGITPAEGAYGGPHGDGDGPLHPPQGWPGRAHGRQPPRVPLFLPCRFQPLEARGGLTHGPDLCWKDEGLRGCRADHCRAPPARGRAPVGPARGAAVVSEEERLAPTRGILAIAAGICTGPAEVAQGFGCHRGNRDHGASPRARQAGEWYSVAAVGLDAVPGFFWHAGGGHPPAVVAFCGDIPSAPGATGAGGIDKAHGCGLRWHRADQLLHGTLAGTDGAELGDRGAMSLRDIGHRHRLFVDIHPDEECGRLGHGCPPRVLG
jgi:hypothetical protein